MFLQTLFCLLKGKSALPEFVNTPKASALPEFVNTSKAEHKNRANMVFSRKLQKKKSPSHKPSVRYSARTRQLTSIAPEPEMNTFYPIYRDNSSSSIPNILLIAGAVALLSDDFSPFSNE